LLAKSGFAYTGNGPTPLRLCRAKDRARALLARAGVRVASGRVVQGARDALRQRFAFPAFVKPARVDGSIGIDAGSVVHDAQALVERVEALARENLPGPYLVETFLPGKEI